MLDITRKQKSALEEKVKELENMKSHLENFESRISESINTGFNKIVLVENVERYLIKYNYVSKTQEELEMNLRNVIIEAEEKFGILNSDIGFTISYEDILKENKVIFKDLTIHLYNDKERMNFENVCILPEGIYLTMYIDDSSFDNRRYYSKMLKYAEDHNIQVVGDFIETEIIARVDKEGRGSNLARIELLCR